MGAWFRVAEIALALGQPREALEAYRRILTFDPWREEAYMGLVETLLHTGQESKARNLFAQYRTRMEREGLPISNQVAQRMQISPGAQKRF